MTSSWNGRDFRMVRCSNCLESQNFSKFRLRRPTRPRKKKKHEGEPEPDKYVLEQGDLISIDQIFDEIIEKTDFLALVMYPTMRARREFVHRCWIIAKAEDNHDLKKAVASDPYFALGRADLLTLLKTKDFETIEFILQKGCKLTVSQDESYKLIAIKKS
jgi:hypothetical protein